RGLRRDRNRRTAGGRERSRHCQGRQAPARGRRAGSSGCERRCGADRQLIPQSGGRWLLTAMTVTGIGELVTHGVALGETALGLVPDAAFAVEDGRIVWVGPAARAPDTDQRLDVGGRAVIPGFVDSHAHLVFAGDRSVEFDARMTGQRYTAGG